jgi:CheY-like chemotaxis protein
MPEGGLIHICAENMELRAGDVVTLPMGKYVRISITDSGIGIAADHLGKIFTPYFTTKQKGSGLGLATSYSIIKKHNGLLTVESKIGRGTTFRIYLPASEKDVSKREEDIVNALTGRGKVLVMDDEEFIRDTAGEMLTALGYSVDFAEDGAEAIDRYINEKEAGSSYDLIIMDLTIPGGMGGLEAVQKLLEIDPGAKALVSSGYANVPIMSDFKTYGFKGVIAKPYSIEELSEAVQNVMVGNS